MRAQLLGAAPFEMADGAVLVVSDPRALRGRRGRGAVGPVLLAGAALPFVDGALDELVDGRGSSAASLEESARVVRPGGRLVLVSDAREGGLGKMLGAVGLGRRAARVDPTEASAWLLGVGCTDLEQTSPREGLWITKGLVRKLVGPVTGS